MKMSRPQPLRCQVEQFQFSAHASRESIVDYIKKVAPKKMVLVHGDVPAVEWIRAQPPRRRCRRAKSSCRRRAWRLNCRSRTRDSRLRDSRRSCPGTSTRSANGRSGCCSGWRETSPDVVCLQETKCTDEQFPELALRDAGYAAVFHGQKSYNGVAILAKEEPREVRDGIVRRVKMIRRRG